MRYIEKKPLPDELNKQLSQARRDDLSWQQFSETFAKSALRDVLVREQAGLCAYSEVRLREFGFHIEHVKPKAEYPQLRFDETNLVASSPRNQADVARKTLFGGHKKEQFRFNATLFISPTEEANCSDFFQYSPDGDIAPKSGLTASDKKRAEETIRCLGLKSRLLKTKRRELYQKINNEIAYMLEQPEAMQAYKDFYLSPDEQGHLKPFQSLIQQVFRQKM